MEIILGKKSGFCYGVQNAVDRAELELKKSNQSIYCLGELVHNKTVTEDLKNKGLIFVNNIKEAKGKTIIRAHGIAKEVYEQGRKQNVDFIDLTCPNVLKIHKIAEEYKENGYFIFLTGKKEHPENIGTISFCGENSYIISDLNEVNQAIEKLKATNMQKVLIISQTTYSLERFNDIVNKINNTIPKNIELEVRNTICLSTEQKQKETEDISKKADAMIVIGGKNSSNTTKLYNICLKNCDVVFFIEDENELQVDEVLKYDKIGIVAGSSTPKSSIDKVINSIKNRKELVYA